MLDLGIHFAPRHSFVSQGHDDPLTAPDKVSAQEGLDQKIRLGVIVQHDAVTQHVLVERGVRGDGCAVLRGYVLVEGGENLGIVHFAAHLSFDLNTAEKEKNQPSNPPLLSMPDGNKITSMEEEIAAILMTFVRSIADQSSAESILHRVHVLRNAIVLRMDWHILHCPYSVCNGILTLLRREPPGERRRVMAVVCDLVFSTLIGHNAYFTHFLNFSEGPDSAYWRIVPAGPREDDAEAVV